MAHVSKVVPPAHVVNVSAPLPTIMYPRSMRYMDALAADTGVDPPHPSVEPAQLVTPLVYVLKLRLALKPSAAAAPTWGGAGHEAQLALDVAPTTDEKEPAGQLPEHVAEVKPAAAPHVPAGHRVHDADTAPPAE